MESLVLRARLFSDCDRTFLEQIIRALVQFTYPRHSSIIDQACPNGMYLVKNGSVKIIDMAHALGAIGNRNNGQNGAASNSMVKSAGESFAEHALFSEFPASPLQASETLILISLCTHINNEAVL